MANSEELSLHRPTLRVCDVMDYLASHPQGSTLTELASHLGIPKGTLAPILSTLLHRQYIAIDHVSKRYTVGIRALAVGSACTSSNPLLTLITIELRQVVSECHETCQLGTLEGGSVFYLAKIDSPEPIRMISSVGMRLPAYCTALGKALLSDLSEAEIAALFPDPFTRRTDRTSTNVHDLCEEVREQADRGLFSEREESAKDITCYALPLRKDNQIVAAISVTIPLFRLDEKRRSMAVTSLRSAQGRIESILASSPAVDNFLHTN